MTRRTWANAVGCAISLAIGACANETLPLKAVVVAPTTGESAKSIGPALVETSPQIQQQSEQVAAETVPSKPQPIPPRPLPIPPAVEPHVSIRIGELASTDAAVIGNLSGSLVVTLAQPSTSDVVWTAQAPIEVRALAAGWRVTERPRSNNSASRAKPNSAPTSRDFPAGELSIDAPSSSSKPMEWDGKSWPGSLRVVRTATGIDLVMDVAMDDYLPGVVAKELYPSWCDAAYHAQAIAARSFAVVEEARWEGRRHYDMVAGQQSQAWIGATTNAKAIAAVRETRGQVLVHDGVVVPAYYSSACGGRPASALGVLTDNPFHDIAPVATGDDSTRRSACCERSSVATWKTTIALAKIQARLQAWGAAQSRPDLVALQLPTSIEVGDRNAAGRPETLVIRSRNARSISLEAEDFRRAINAAGDPKSSMRSSDFSVRIAAGNAEFSGRGFGHGVGMCQHGAEAMGRAGASYQQILARYYPQSMIVQAWK